MDVPGSPRVILTPGHTPGSAALHFASLGALFVGDAFATYAVTTGARGPQVAPFTADAARPSNRWHALTRSPPTTCFPGMATPGPAASGKQPGRYARHREKTRDYLTSQPGYVDTALHQAVTPAADFQFVNIAHWQR